MPPLGQKFIEKTRCAEDMQRTISRLRTFLKYRDLFFQLVSRDIKLKYRRSILGYLWSMLNPLLSMIVLTIVFSNLFGRGIDHFPVYVITGQLLFNLMAGSTTRSLHSVIGNAGILKKIFVPKYIFTLSTVSSEMVNFIFSLGALFVLIIATNAPLSGRFIFIIIPIVQLYIFCIGLGLFLAQATVFFRDVQHIWGVIVTAWMFLSAIFYPVDILPDMLHHIVTRYNPMYFYISMFRNFTIGTPNMGNPELIIRGAVAAGAMLFVGLASFSCNKNKFILHM